MNAGINLKWDYTQHIYRLTTENYISDIRLKWIHPDPNKRQLPPYKHTPIIYGAKIEYAAEPFFSLPLDNKGIFRVQSVFGDLLYYSRSVDNKLLFGLNELDQQQAYTTKDTNADIIKLLDYLATYPNDGILYQDSGMVLSGH